VDYKKILSLVVRHTSKCVLLALVQTLGMELQQIDVKIAFLHGRLEEDILMQQLKGFEVEGKKKSICKLKSSLYG